MPTTVSDALIITIDGPAGTGKSTVAAGLARRLGLARLDTGAMYRTVALIAVREQIDPADTPALLAALAAHELYFDCTVDPPVMSLDGEDVEPHIRSARVGEVVSEIAAVPEIRRAMVHMQQATARAHPRLVSEGRDQGSVVFPDAQVRFYLTADPNERVRRRVAQLEADGASVDAAQVAAEIDHRDALDAGRDTSPLRCPDGAVEVDTTGMSIDDVIDALERTFRETFDAEC